MSLMSDEKKCKGLLQRLADGEHVIIGEGYLFAFERRGYLKAGPFVPEVVLEHPELVRQQHEEFVHAGSDVVLAFTYYGHREKLRLIGREDDLESLNRKALRIARQVADQHNCLMAGNISNTTIHDSSKPETDDIATAMFKEQIEWAVEEGVDFIVAETFITLSEAKLALAAIKRFGKGVPAVITMSALNSGATLDGLTLAQSCRQLEDLGADVVGLNCHRGPATMLPELRKIREACKGYIAALPVPYRTHEEALNFMALRDPETGLSSFPTDLDRWYCTRSEIAAWGRTIKELGIQYLGLCCGATAAQLRSLAMAVGRDPPASRYAADMSKHFIFSKAETFKNRQEQQKNLRHTIMGENSKA